jgi:glycosyltransferase involved in cell wall biosynthesis
MRILIALSGLHRVDRGAEIAFVSVARELARAGDRVTLIGSGPKRSDEPYTFVQAKSISRQHFARMPSLPLVRNDCAYEELTFLPSLLKLYRPQDYDVTVTCSYPFTNWVLRRPIIGGATPAHVFVTQNGDWPAQANNSEYRFFSCDGLVCINPDAYERNKTRWRSALIPNGVDRTRFTPGLSERQGFGLPNGKLVILMVSALIASKRVQLGMKAASLIPNAHFIVAGDGPEREAVDAMAARLLPGRFTRVTVSPDKMPALYRSADVFLHLSKDESFGNVFIEALACGLPIVGLDTPRLRWIVGDDEFLVTNDSPEELAASIRRTTTEASEPGPERAKRADAFSWTRIGKQYRDFLGQVVAEVGARRIR